MTNSNQNTNFKLELNDQGFYELIIKDNVEISIEDAILIREAQKKMGGKRLPMLIYGGKYSSTNTDALKFISKNENMPYSKASAYLMFTLSQILLGNFYLKMNKPERPTRFFKNKEEAIIWLKQYI